MTAGDVVRGGQMSDCAVFEFQVRRLRGPDGAAGRFHCKGLNSFDVAHEIADDFAGMRIQRLQMVIRAVKILRLSDPKRHIAEKKIAQQAFVLPLLCCAGSGRKAMVEVQRKAAVQLLCGLNHVDSVLNDVGDGLFRKHVAACFQRLNRRYIVVGGIFVAAGCDRYEIGLQFPEHRKNVVIRFDAEFLCCRVRAFAVYVADADQFDQLILHINSRMEVSDMA